MSTWRSLLARTLPHAGIDSRRLGSTVRGAPRFLRDYRRFRAMLLDQGLEPLPIADLFPILGDLQDESGAASGHYFHQDIWAARKIHSARPTVHYDIGSRIDGFVASLVVFQPVVVIDVRPMTTEIQNLSFVQADATKLAFLDDESVDSISTLHAIEHFGLGRYGDPIDPNSWREAVTELVRVAAPGGRVYFSTPIGRERVMFNAHRVFSPQSIIDAFAGLELVSFAAVDDAGRFVPVARPEDLSGADYACGLFEFSKAPTIEALRAKSS